MDASDRLRNLAKLLDLAAVHGPLVCRVGPDKDKANVVAVWDLAPFRKDLIEVLDMIEALDLPNEETPPEEA